MTTELFETHCHLDTFEPEEVPNVLERARRCYITRFTAIGASDGIKSAFRSRDLAEQYPEVWFSAGVHPHDAGKHQDLEPLEELWSHPKCVALGETGLDFFRDWAPKELQFELFETSIRKALEKQKKLIIHCRSAATETLEVLQRLGADRVGGVFHCYSEDAAYAAKLREMNFLVSFPGSITFKKADAIREVVRDIPLDQIMVETDTPYMAPEPFRGKPSEPMHVYQVALKIAEIKGISFEEVAAETTATAKNFFGIEG